MTRDPSLHVTRSILCEALAEELGLGPVKSLELANSLLQYCKGKSPVNRKYVVNSQYADRKATRLAASTLESAGLFSSLLTSVRKSLKHKGITHIDRDHSFWPVIKKVSASASEFCDHFSLPYREGYIEFIQNGIALMKNKYSLHKFNWYLDDIYEAQEAKKKVQAFSDSPVVRAIHDLYVYLAYEKTGIKLSYKEPGKYVNFCKLVEDAASISAKAEDFLKAQFAAISYREGFPELHTIHGEQATSRYLKYAYENGINTKKFIDTKKPTSIDFSKIRKT